jgi:hypothetical protein
MWLVDFVPPVAPVARRRLWRMLVLVPGVAPRLSQ